jgi:hypothetical protein
MILHNYPGRNPNGNDRPLIDDTRSEVGSRHAPVRATIEKRRKCDEQCQSSCRALR